MALSSTVVSFSVETWFSLITVLISFVFYPLEIRCYVTLFYKFIARALEEISLFCFISPVLSDKTLSSGSCFYRLLLPSNFFFQNKRIYLLMSLYDIFWNADIDRYFNTFILLVRHQIHLTLSHLNFSHTLPWFSWTSNLNYIVYWNICQSLCLFPSSCMFITCLSLNLELPSFKYDTSYLFMSAFHASFEFSLYYLASSKFMSSWLIISKF